MAREIEIKLRVSDLRAFQQALRRLGARVASSKGRRVHEWNELFDTPGGGLRRRGQLLRVRSESVESSGGRWEPRAQPSVLTFKRPIRGMGASHSRSQKYKVREEIEAKVGDARPLVEVLQAMGMRVWFRYEKYRTTFRLPHRLRWARSLLIELDETPIGSFVELEGPQRAIDRAAKALGYERRDYITANYFVLYREHCRQNGKKPGDQLGAMLFKGSAR
jgi:adenylate cyclase, class 2